MYLWAMPKGLKNSICFKHIALVWLILFSLSPCPVKETWFLSLGTDYAQQGNKTKTTSSTTNCLYLQFKSQGTSSIYKAQPSSGQNEDYFLYTHLLSSQSVACNLPDLNIALGSSPPKYILYKRWKMDIV